MRPEPPSRTAGRWLQQMQFSGPGHRLGPAARAQLGKEILHVPLGRPGGAALGKVVTSLVNDILMPPIGLLLGQLDFSNLFITLDGQSYDSLAAAREAGAPTLNYGELSKRHPLVQPPRSAPTASPAYRSRPRAAATAPPCSIRPARAAVPSSGPAGGSGWGAAYLPTRSAGR